MSTSDHTLEAAISLVTALDRLRSQVHASVLALEPYAEIHPYLAVQLDRLRAAVEDRP